MSKDNTDSEDENRLLSKLRRRSFLAGLGAAAAGTAVGSNAPDVKAAGSKTETIKGGDRQRIVQAYELREAAARDLLRGGTDTAGSGVIGRYDAKHGTYTKALPHNKYGEVDLDAYHQLDKALEGTDLEEYNNIPLAKDRGLANPIAARAFNLIGADGHQEPMPETPAVGSDVAAAEMVELYWRALLRDVPFEEYGSNPAAQAAYDELAGLDAFEGPTQNGPYRDLFRSPYEGAREGPYVSQFILQDAPVGTMTLKNKFEPQVKEDFMTDFDDWLSVRRGEGDVVRTEEFMDDERRITNGRDLLTYVHRNIPVQSAISAAYIMLGMGIPRDESIMNRPLDTQNQFIEFGPPFVTTLVNGVVDNVKHGTWYHKWLVHRRCRPEKYGGLVHVHKSDMDRTYDFLNDDLLDSKAVKRTNSEYGSWLLPQGYPEGSPTHPSYPAGHSAFIGASVTVLKAIFDGDATLDRTVRVGANGEAEETNEELTVRGELNKLASNHAFGRDFSGIHYRTDGREGHLLGEKVALEYLKDELRGTVTDVELTLKGFQGDNITVTEDEIRRE